MKQFLIGLLVAVGLAVASGLGGVVPADGSTSHWSKFEKTHGTSSVVTVKVYGNCLNAEDSAAHLKLLRYGNGVAVYGCDRGGY
jgi:hypothetical protein